MNIMNTLHEFIEGSPKRHDLFQHIQDPKIRTLTLKNLSATRWACRIRALSALEDAYPSVVLFLQITDDNDRSEAGAKANGLLSAITKFEFMFIVHLLRLIFAETSILHTTLQKKEIDLTTALSMATLTKRNLIEMRDSIGVFDELYGKTEKLADKFDNDIEDQITAGATRKKTRKNNQEDNESASLTKTKRFNDLYKSTFNCFIEEIESRFNTENYEPILFISRVILATKNDNIIKSLSMLSIYNKVINLSQLKLELNLWTGYKESFQLNSLNEIISHFDSKPCLHNVFPNIFLLLKIYLSIPVSSAGAERSFSCLNLLKNCLRTTMNQDRLSSLAVIHMNSDVLSALNIDKIIDKFAQNEERRISFRF